MHTVFHYPLDSNHYYSTHSNSRNEETENDALLGFRER